MQKGCNLLETPYRLLDFRAPRPDAIRVQAHEAKAFFVLWRSRITTVRQLKENVATVINTLNRSRSPRETD